MGSSDENYQIRRVADIVQNVVRGEIVLSDTGLDIRDYRWTAPRSHRCFPASPRSGR